MMSKHYKYFQPNDKDKKDDYSDCVIRALCKVMNKTWLEAFDELLPIARDIQCNPNSKPCYKRYLEEHGFEYVGISNKKGSKRPTVESFTKEHKEGTYFLSVANHVVASVEGYFYDTWDSGDCCLYGYWKKNQ